MARVLLIDDEMPFRQTIAKFLTRAGYEVVEAENGQLGLRAFEQSKFDAIVTDIIMPDIEGLELIRTVRSIDPNIPVVAMSGGGRVSGMQPLKVAKILGASAVLYKPFERAQLLEAMAAALGRAPAA